MFTRSATLDDVAELRQLIDTQESALDSRHKPAPDSWPADAIRGHFPHPLNQVWCDQSGAIVAWASCQFDPQRKRVEIEIFRRPGFPGLDEVWSWCAKRCAEAFPGISLWPTINHLDSEMARLLQDSGFDVLRRYHLLTRPLTEEMAPPLPEGVTVELIVSKEDFHAWHEAHHDAFSRHFGFVKRPFDEWCALVTDSESADPQGRFLLRVEEEPAGYVICSLDNAHENGGFVSLLGVTHRHQGRGFGELLLRWAFTYCAGKGYKEIDLFVDTGNESRALKLYDKVGFHVLSEFHLYARPSADFV